MANALPSAPAMPDDLAARLSAARAALAANTHARARDADGGPRYVNRLALEASPYLLAHACNPVNWYPWSDEAFSDASRLGRPVFLSIGYSTCHWCHVMEEESFEDEEIAAFLNASFVPIKVDREERPDVDAIYMQAALQLSGAGGWPLSVWLTPDRRPFFAGTYFPPRAGARGPGPGFMEILTAIVRFYGEQPDRVEEAAQTLSAAVRSSLEKAASPANDGPDAPAGLPVIARAVEQCARNFDDRHGGLRASQKFPSHVPIRLLLRYAERTGDANARHMAVRTLESMAKGGIYDHLAGGFHRYATDEEWLVPHFEKMLYDNALLVVAYAEAWQVTKREQFMRVVRETCDELLATFAAPDGGFFSATDADSAGEEGTFYLWSEDEIRAILGPGETTSSFLRHYGVTPEGNFEGRNILFERESDEDTVRSLANARARLREVRAKRERPFRDEKLLAGWNGLAISAFATAGWVAREQRYLDAAKRAARFLLDRMRDPRTQALAHSFCAGRLGPPGFLGDYAALAAGLLDLFEYTGEPRWLDDALRLCEQTERLFADPQAGGWHASGSAHEQLLAREKPSYDGAEPSGASLALMNVARLATFTDSEVWRGVAEHAVGFYLPLLADRPMAMTEALRAVDFLAGPALEIALALPAADAGHALVDCMRDTFCPRRVLVMGEPTSSTWRELEGKLPYLAGKSAIDNRATAFVCEHGQCQLPTQDPLQLRDELQLRPSWAR